MTNICPSAQPDVNVPEMLKFLIENEVYKEDYENITARLSFCCKIYGKF